LPILKQKSKQKMLGTEISIKIFVKIHYLGFISQPRLKNNWEIHKNLKSLDKSWQISILIEKYCRDKIKKSQSQLSRPTFWKCSDFPNCRDRESRLRHNRHKSRPPGLVFTLTLLSLQAQTKLNFEPPNIDRHGG
jgi:hypothetical protein